jgi:crotonobetaine/carnitine-CoA ligase
MSRVDLTKWTVSRALAQAASASPDATFIETTNGRTVTFGDLDRDTTRLAGALKARGVQHGGAVLMMARNSIEFVLVWIALNKLGALLVPINTAFKGEFFDYICRDSGADTIFIDPEFMPILAESHATLPNLRIAVSLDDLRDAPIMPGWQILSLSQLMSGPVAEFDPDSVLFRDTAAILYTSGTTGRSKGVLLPHAHLYQNAYLFMENIGVRQNDVIYCCLPLFHLNALTLQAYCALIAQCKLVLAPGFSASKWLPDIRAHSASITNLLGSMIDFVFAQPQSENDADNSLRIINAVPVPSAFGDEFEQRFGVKLIELYGTTELTCPIYMPRTAPTHPGRCGKLLSDWFEARIVDSETDLEVPVGTVGELVVRPSNPWCCMAAYHKLPEETVAAWRNLWFHTGDAMRVDAEGYYYFVDRMKDCLRRRGENISSYEVERVLLAHPVIQEAAVTGVPSPFQVGDQEVKASVVFRDGATLDPAEIVNFCETRMPKFAVPRIIEICSELPKTSTGKIRKDELRKRGISPAAWVDTSIERQRPRPS